MAMGMQAEMAQHLFWVAESVWIGMRDMHGLCLGLEIRILGGKKWVTSCNLSFLASSDTLSAFLCGGIETSLLPVSTTCVTSFPRSASLFPQSRLSNEHFRFIKGSFENVF